MSAATSAAVEPRGISFTDPSGRVMLIRSGDMGPSIVRSRFQISAPLPWEPPEGNKTRRIGA
jgi:hypothetical protein